MTEIKDTNPKDSVGIRKAGMSCVPAEVLLELGLAMQEGARKYGRHNYRVTGVRASVYYDAVMRHIMAWWEGEDIDPDSGLSHLVKAMACLLVIRDASIYGSWVDDRPPSLNVGWQVELNKKASDLIDRMPNSKEAYVRDELDQFINDFDAEFGQEQNGYAKDVTTGPVSFYPLSAESRDYVTTNPPLPPLPHSHSHTASMQGCIDPKQDGKRQLRDLSVPGDNAYKFVVE